MSKLLNIGITPETLSAMVGYSVVYYKASTVVEKYRLGKINANLLVPYFGACTAVEIASKTLSESNLDLVIKVLKKDVITEQNMKAATARNNAFARALASILQKGY